MASSTVTLVSTPAGPPFADADADLVLRSSDKVDFHVHKFLLSLASPVFKDILSIPDTTIYSGASDEPHDVNEYKDGILVIHVAEQRQVLENLLRLVYPTDNGRLTDLSSVRELFQAMDKYKMLDLFPRTIDRDLLDIARAHPFAAYAIACRYQRLALANEIAPFTLQQPFLADAFDEEDVNLITTYQYNQLHQYHQKCRDSALRALQAFSRQDPTLAKIKRLGYCGCPRTCFHADRFPTWFIEYLDCCEATLKITPHWQTAVADELLMPLIAAVIGCVSHCHLLNDIFQFCHRLKSKIISEIKERRYTTIGFAGARNKLVQHDALPFPQASSTKTISSIGGEFCHPFGDATTDLILRSSDNVDFHVHSWLLSKASPTLKRTILSEAQHQEPSDTDVLQDNGVRILQMMETHQELESFLRLICPTDNPEEMLISRADIWSVNKLFQAAEKYGMLDLFPQTLEGVLFDIAVTRPFAAYAIACHYRMFTTANSLACLTLRMSFLADTFSGPELEWMTVRQYQLLLRYHQKCSDLATEAFVSDRIPPEILQVATCRNCGRYAELSLSKWSIQYLDDCKAVVQTQPLGDSLWGDVFFLRMVGKAVECSSCRKSLEKLRQCSQLLKDHVSSVIDQVPPPFPEAVTKKARP